MLLMSMEHLDVIGIAVTPADCYIEPAVSATRKILDLMGRSEVPVAASTVRGVNPFPRAFRVDSHSIDLFPILNERAAITAPRATEAGQHFVARKLREAPAPVTFLETGPLTTLAEALQLDSGLESKIERIVWMGGALSVRGNVSPMIDPKHDMSAEWNVYWDPFAAERIWRTQIPIVLCPLDITNTVPITPEFIQKVSGQRRYPLSDLAGLCYALVAYRPYYCWDVLTTAYLGRPDLFTLKEWETEILTAEPSEGRTRVKPGGRKIMALDTVDKDAFFEYFLRQLAR
jgi:purine nucleosidase